MFNRKIRLHLPTILEPKKDAEALLVTMHSTLREVMFNDIYGPHHAAGGIMDQISATVVTSARRLDPSQHTSQRWRYYYETINSADIIIDNIHRFPFPAEEMEPYRLQACFTKGLMYFMLAQRWGESRLLEGQLILINWPRVLLVMSLMRLKDGHCRRWNFKCLKNFGMSMVILGRQNNMPVRVRLRHYWLICMHGVLLFEGKNEYWEEAEKYCTMIMNNEVGFYDLAKSPEQVCSEVLSRNSVESIWEVYKSTEERIASKILFFGGFFWFPCSNGFVGRKPG